MFFWNSLAFSVIQWMLAIWSLVPLTFSKSSLYIWKFSIHVPLKPDLKDFEHDLASIWNEFNSMVVWTFFGISFLLNWNEHWPFPVYMHAMGQILAFQSDIFFCKLPRLSGYHFPGTDRSGGAMDPEPGRDLPQRLTALPSLSFPLSVWDIMFFPSRFLPESHLEHAIEAVHA